MKYTSEVTIGLPRERVIELFDSSENLSRWQPDLRRAESVVLYALPPRRKREIRPDMLPPRLAALLFPSSLVTLAPAACCFKKNHSVQSGPFTIPSPP
jgi:hypothetical protein